MMYWEDPSSCQQGATGWIGDEHDEESESGDSGDSDVESVCSAGSSVTDDLTDTLRVGMFPPFIKEHHIHSHFSHFAKFIKRVNIKPKETTAYAFVTFSSSQMADNAQQVFQGSRLLGEFPIKIKPAQRKASTNDGKKRRKRTKGVKLFVGNLPPGTKATDVSSHFAKYQQHLVGNPEIIPVSKEGKSAFCIAFLSFRSKKVAVAAVEEMNGTRLLQRLIKVEFKKGKKESQQQPSAAAAAKKTPKKCVDTSEKPVATSQIRITGIPSNFDEEDLKDLLTDSSCLCSCTFRTEKGNKKVAVMSFSTATAASEAVERFDGNQFLGQTLHACVETPAHLQAKWKGSRRPSTGQSSKVFFPRSQSSTVTVKVFNLPENSTRKAVFHHFKDFVKTVDQVKVSGTVASISFPSMEEANQAQAKWHSTIFNGKVIGVIVEPPQVSTSQNLTSDHEELKKKALNTRSGKANISDRPKNRMGANVAVTKEGAQPVAASVAPPTTFNPPPLFPSPPSQVSFNGRSSPQGPGFTPVTALRHREFSASPATMQRGMSPQLFEFIEHQAGEGVSAFRRMGGSLRHSGHLAVIVAPSEHECVRFVQQVLGRYKEMSLVCSRDQWNRLMLIGSHGKRLMDELREPFRSHPHLRIHELPTPGQLKLLFVGIGDAVDSAFSHFHATLNKELQVKSLVMQTLTELKPGLAEDISKGCGVYLDGYNPHSTEVSFHGASDNVRQAKEEFERRVSSVFLYSVPQEDPLPLLKSAVKLLKKEGQTVAVLQDDSGNHIGSFSKADIEAIKKVLKRKPYVNFIPVRGEGSSLSLDALEELCGSDCVRLRREEEKVLVEGFVKEDVQQARVLMQKSLKVGMSKSHCLLCAPEQEAYLLHLLTSKKCSDRAQQIKASLPAGISYSKDQGKIFLKGTQDERDKSTQLLLECVPSHFRSHHFTCHPAFYSQIERQVLRKYASVESVKVEETQGEKKGPLKFSIILFANSVHDLQSAMEDVQVVDPGSMKVLVRPQARELVWSYKANIEMRYNCRLEIRDKPHFRVMVHALSEENRVAAKAAVESRISENLVIEQEIPDIPLSSLQMRYIVVKHRSRLMEIKDSLEECDIPYHLEHKPALTLQEEGMRIKVRGKLRQVEEAKEVMNELTSDFVAEKFEVCSPPAKLPVWTKRWKQLKQDQEEAKELMVDYDTVSKSTDTSNFDLVRVPFVVYGSDVAAVRVLKQSIQEEVLQGVEDVTLNLSEDEAKAVDAALRNCQFSIETSVVDVSSNGARVILSAAKAAVDDLFAVKEEIKNFVEKRMLSSTEFSTESLAVNLLLTCKKAHGYFTMANKLCGESHVSVQPTCKGRVAFLTLRGSKDAVEVARSKLSLLGMQIKQYLTTKQIAVEPHMAPALTASFIRGVQSKLRSEYCVVATFSGQQKPIPVLKEVYLQPRPSSVRVKLAFHKGNLLGENVDVIVSPANEYLNHHGGLAKVVADAGGPALQRESLQYIQESGKLEPGEVVCLGAGSLPYKKVIYVVCPLQLTEINFKEQQLYLTMFKALCKAESCGFESIAFPALGTGESSMPEDVCARVLLKAVGDFCQSNQSSSIRTIIFSLLTSVAQKAFVAALPHMPSLNYIEEVHHIKSAMEEDRQSFHWEWMNDQLAFCPYSPDVCRVLTAEYNKNPWSTTTITIDGTLYNVDFANMLQTNVATSSRRSIRCLEAATQPGSIVPPTAVEASYQTGLLSEEQKETEFLICLEGPEMLLGPAEEHVKSQLQECIRAESVTLPSLPGKSFEKSLVEKARGYGMWVKVVGAPLGQAVQKRVIELKGVKAKVDRALRDLQEAIMSQQSSSDSPESFPPEWQPQTQMTELQTVAPGSSEWLSVERKFRCTMLSSNLVEIVRVQNTWLWERYSQHKNRLQEKNGPAGVNEMELFHGTKDNNPCYIYEGEEGFDMRFSEQGLWGYANYFATNASYAHGYAYHNALGQREIFLAKVLTGESCPSVPNPSLRMPPEKQATQGSVTFSLNRYDTVTGFTCGSRIYMTYDNQKAYPAYLIRYN